MRAALDRLPSISPAATYGGSPGIVDLWYWFNDRDASSPERTSLEWCSEDERARLERFTFPKDRALFLATRVLVRTVLSQYVGVGPQDWRFGAGRSGKPFIHAPQLDAPLHFNLTHTAGLVACAVSGAHSELGLDAERLSRRLDFLQVARRYFSPLEVRSIHEASPSELSQRFFGIWTLKESYVKARGDGLGLPLDRFGFTLHDDGTVAFESVDGGEGPSWRFARIEASPFHVMAIGVNTGGAELSLRAGDAGPLCRPVWGG